MPSEVDLIIERSSETLERARARITAPSTIGVRRTLERVQRFAKYSFVGVLALLLGTGVWSLLVSPIGIFGVLIVGMLALGIVAAAGMASREAEVKVSQIPQGKLVQVAERTERWLAQQRRALPAPAQTLADSIGTRIMGLRGRLGEMDDAAPEGAELRRLVGEELPELVSSYMRVPENLRRAERNGRVAEQDLVQGLTLLDEEIDTLGRQLAASDMDRLSSQKRYLEMRYRDDEPTG